MITAENLIKATNLTFDDWEVIKKLMIDFAKLHVTEALKAASEQAMWSSESEETYFGADKDNYHFIDTDGAGDPCTGFIVSVNKDSILNAYNLNNIK